jgi:hypothetical protein
MLLLSHCVTAPLSSRSTCAAPPRCGGAPTTPPHAATRRTGVQVRRGTGNTHAAERASLLRNSAAESRARRSGCHMRRRRRRLTRRQQRDGEPLLQAAAFLRVLRASLAVCCACGARSASPTAPHGSSSPARRRRRPCVQAAMVTRRSGGAHLHTRRQLRDRAVTAWRWLRAQALAHAAVLCRGRELLARASAGSVLGSAACSTSGACV